VNLTQKDHTRVVKLYLFYMKTVFWTTTSSFFHPFYMGSLKGSLISTSSTFLIANICLNFSSAITLFTPALAKSYPSIFWQICLCHPRTRLPHTRLTNLFPSILVSLPSHINLFMHKLYLTDFICFSFLRLLTLTLPFL
jgi:hypothetical protein